MKVHTESGSIYEIESNPEGKCRVRRLVNGAPAADSVRASEQWRDAIKVYGPIVGQPMVIAWTTHGEIVESTVTSFVIGITTDTV